jgi:chorismate-pyruvate lyase
VSAASASPEVGHGTRRGAGPAVLHRRDRDRLVTRTFTELLRRQSGDDLAVRIVEVTRRPAGPATAGLLGVPPERCVHRRRTVLSAAGSGHALAWAESLLVTDRLDPHLREPAVQGTVPLGDVLAVAERGRDLIGWHLGVDLPVWAPATGRPAAEWPTITRTTRIAGGADPVALVTEWWPACDAERPR